MGLRRKTYADTHDLQMLRVLSHGMEERRAFVTDMFDRFGRDQSFRRGVLVNVGAGRAVVPDEVPFFRQFERVVLMEPDDERRALLQQDPGAAGAEFLGDPIQELDPQALPGADFVLCKWVLQHLPTADVALAVDQLKALCAPGGSVAIFSASSAAEPYFMLSAQPEVIAQLPRHLRPAPGNRVARAQFDELIVDTSGLEFITTHHLSRAWLAERFAGWEVQTSISSLGAICLQAHRPASG